MIKYVTNSTRQVDIGNFYVIISWRKKSSCKRGGGLNLNINCSINYINVFSPSFSETSQPAVYSSTIQELSRFSAAEVNEIGCKVTEDFPLNSIIWKPSVMLTKYHAWYYVGVIFLHLIPGLLIDGLIKLSGNKPLYVHIHCTTYVHIYIMLMMLYLPAAGVTYFQMK
jgi:hypothetical protein